MKKFCGNCEHTDGRIYTSNPPKVKCTITEEFHYKSDECNRNESTGESYSKTYNSYVSQGWLCPRCGKINAPWMSQCNCTGKPMEITCGDYTHYPTEWSTAGAHPNAFVTLSGEISDEVRELLRKWRKDPAADYFIDRAEEK